MNKIINLTQKKRKNRATCRPIRIRPILYDNFDYEQRVLKSQSMDLQFEWTFGGLMILPMW